MKSKIKSLLILTVIAVFPLLFFLYDIFSGYIGKTKNDKAASSLTQKNIPADVDKLIKSLEISCKNKISQNVYDLIIKKGKTDLSIEVMLHTETKPGKEQITSLENAGATAYLEESWVDPTDTVKTGNFLVEIPIKNIESLCTLQFIKLISSGE